MSSSTAEKKGLRSRVKNFLSAETSIKLSDSSVDISNMDEHCKLGQAVAKTVAPGTIQIGMPNRRRSIDVARNMRTGHIDVAVGYSEQSAIANRILGLASKYETEGHLSSKEAAYIRSWVYLTIATNPISIILHKTITSDLIDILERAMSNLRK